MLARTIAPTLSVLYWLQYRLRQELWVSDETHGSKQRLL